MTRRSASTLTVIIAVLITAAGVTFHKLKQKETHGIKLQPEITAIINMGKYNPHSSRLKSGYNYHLLKKFADYHSSTIRITVSDWRDHILDSLRAGTADIAVIDISDTIDLDSTVVWYRVDSAGIWVFDKSFSTEIKKLDAWMKLTLNSDEDIIDRQRFFDIYTPSRRVSADFISPYDSIIKVCADTLGWDWKLLASLIYQESCFKIEARSPRGALGLMQIMPLTARRLDCDNIFDPEENIKAGTAYLLKLSHRYRRFPGLERTKLTIAAYNAGEGRIRDCINFARYCGTDSYCWDSIVKVIPKMRQDSIASLDTVKLGIFKGYETINYVETIFSNYDKYKTICP